MKKSAGKKLEFYVVATPIGNLEDVTFRAVDTLKKADLVLCEDTRITKRLLDKYSISKPLLSYHQRSKLSRTETIIEHMLNNKTCVLVTDAGTPGISDPGNELVAKIVDFFGEQIKIVPIPGPSALAALASVAGIDMSKFSFFGFPPHKKGRETFFMNVLEQQYPVIYYDSPHRFLKNLQLIKELNSERERNIRLVVGREMTKIFEEVKRGGLKGMIEYFSLNNGKIKGELTVILY